MVVQPRTPAILNQNHAHFQFRIEGIGHFMVPSTLNGCQMLDEFDKQLLRIASEDVYRQEGGKHASRCL